ncbi:hypothetical protein [Thermomonospora amylolytica]|uniref:hypothetical protein n=1 Tax=Thermomonospora amylolytica TaxID=1411117 RepID=UPI0013001C56|nr:hypothetical protein [Thermomonospora amylolytica]
MSDVPPLNPMEQKALLEEITLVLVHSLPPGWQGCTVLHRALGSHSETLGQFWTVSRQTPRLLDPHPALAELFGRLRSGMYVPQVGTWFKATFRLDFPFSHQVSYSRDEPDWRSTAPPPGAYAEELRVFPRSPENVPSWLTSHADPGTP